MNYDKTLQASNSFQSHIRNESLCLVESNILNTLTYILYLLVAFIGSIEYTH